MNAKPHLQVVAAIIYHPNNGRILISKRRQQAHQGGLWEFPGGKREAGESEEAALHRELREELGIAVQRPELFHREHFEYPEKCVSLAFYTVTMTVDSQPQACEVDAFTWVAASDLHRYPFPPANVPVVTRLGTT